MKLYLVRHGQSTGNIGGTLMGQSDHPLTALGEDQARAAAERLAPFGPMPVYASDLPRARATAERIVAAWREEGVADAPQVTPDPRLREISLGDYEGRPWQEFEADTALTAAFAEDPYRTALPNGESLEHLEARVRAAVLDILAPIGVDETGAYCGNAVSQGDASATDRNTDAMRAGAAAAAVDGAAAAVAADDAMEADAELPETMDASAVATGFLPVDAGGSACLVAHDGPIRAILNHYLGVPPEKWWTLSTTHGGVSLIEFAGGCVTIRYVNATGHLVGLEPEKYVPGPSDDEAAPA
jgi:probable phosphoglycerate mutase